MLRVILLTTLCVCICGADVLKLYHEMVTFAEYYTRDLKSSATSSFGKRDVPFHFHHAGVVVTTSDQQKWLIHKGNDFGQTWDTVIVNASYMTQAWTMTKCGDVINHTVNDFMVAGKIHCTYSLLRCNCQHAANAMWKLVTERLIFDCPST